MMIDPKGYVVLLKDSDYFALMEERDRLISFIKDFEEKEISGDRTSDEWLIHPQPDVRYQVYLEYLSELCCYMQDRYNKDYVWGERTLKDDLKGQ